MDILNKMFKKNFSMFFISTLIYFLSESKTLRACSDVADLQR